MSEEGTNSGGRVISLDSDIAELERLSAFIDKFCELQQVPRETGYDLQVALEELVLNVIKYGECEPKQAAIRLTMARDGAAVSIMLSDNGIRFNPLEAPSPDLTQNLQDRPVGGLGIHLVRHLVPSIRYERRDGRNCLYLTKPV